MTLIKFTIKTSCEESINGFQKCIDNITTKIELLTGKLRIKESYFGHISISHKQNDHTIWLFLYDKAGIHESESNGKIIIQDNKFVKKFSKTIPTENQLKKAIQNGK